MFCFETTPLTSVKLQDTALHFLSTWGRRITSLPPWNSSSEGSCLERGEVLTLYLEKSDGGWEAITMFQNQRRSIRNLLHLNIIQSAEREKGGKRVNEKRDLLLRHVSIPADVHLPKLEPSTVIPVTMREKTSISQQTRSNSSTTSVAPQTDRWY